MTAELLARLGGPVGALGVAVLVLAPFRALKLAGLALVVLGIALFVPFLAPASSYALLAAAGALAAPAAAALAALFVRYPWTLPLLALAAVPARVPVSVGDARASLLVPLYVVIAGAVLALGWSLWREPGAAGGKELGPLSWPVALLVLWLGVSALWTIDVDRASIELFSFILPFSLLAVALARLPWSERGAVWLYRLLAAMALLFAAVGVGQWLTGTVFWNPRVIAWNAFAPGTRVNSLFWDPSMYGRFLVVAILASLVLLLFRASRRWDLGLGAVVAALWVGLLFSFSQSSFAALFAGVALAAALAWRWRAAAALALVTAVMVPVGVASPGLDGVRAAIGRGSEQTLNRATSGRVEIVGNGVAIAADNPVVGVGVGGFRTAYAERLGLDREPPGGVSHTTPVTMAAEAGVIGLGLFAWLVVAALLLALRGGGGKRDLAAQAKLAAGVALAAIAVHAVFYDAFLEDPMTWGLLALALVAASAREAGSPTAGDGRGGTGLD